MLPIEDGDREIFHCDRSIVELYLYLSLAPKQGHVRGGAINLSLPYITSITGQSTDLPWATHWTVGSQDQITICDAMTS